MFDKCLTSTMEVKTDSVVCPCYVPAIKKRHEQYALSVEAGSVWGPREMAKLEE